MASNCCYWGARVSRSVVFVFASSQVTNAFVATQQLCRSAIRTSAPCGFRLVACHVQVALQLSFLGPPWCQWCSDWYALGCSAKVAFGCGWSSHVSGWLTSVEVFAAVPLGVSGCLPPLSSSSSASTHALGEQNSERPPDFL